MRNLRLLDGSILKYDTEGVEYFPAGDSIRIRGVLEKVLTRIGDVEIYLRGIGFVSLLRNYGEGGADERYEIVEIEVEDSRGIPAVEVFTPAGVEEIDVSRWDISLRVGGDF